MANTSQTYSTETSIQNDFKIFLGKKSEIVEILATGRVVDKKWYLAWDTGEIFIGNKLHKLMKFGGSNENLTSDTVKDIIESETRGNFNEIRKQAAKMLQNYNDLAAAQRQLEFEYGSTIASLNENMRETIKAKVTEVLSDYSNITYSKTEIDNKVNTTVTNLKTFIQNNYVDKPTLANYATTEYVNTKVNGSLIYATGNTIKSNISNRLSGLFFSTSKSDDNTIEKAHIYYVMNGTYEDMTPAGSGGGGGVYVPPTISLLYNDTVDGTNKQVTSKLLELGSSFNGTRTFAWSCSNGAQISGSLSFLVPASPTPDNTYRTIKSNINPLSANRTITLTNEMDGGGLINPAEGEYSYTVSGVDKQGTVVKGSFILKVVGPIYFGEYNALSPNAIMIQSFPRVLRENVAGEYSVTINTTGKYAWLCIPATMSISGFALSGFKAPFEEPVIQVLTFGNVTTNYKCYRSTEPLQAGHVTITVV